MKTLELLFVYVFGAICYGGIEMLWRGTTHWTMLLLGGACFLCIYLITVRTGYPLPVKWLFCTLSVTVLELLCGLLLNRWLGWGVWDYSAMRGNILGQICPRYVLYWYLLSIPCSAMAQALKIAVFENIA